MQRLGSVSKEHGQGQVLLFGAAHLSSGQRPNGFYSFSCKLIFESGFACWPGSPLQVRVSRQPHCESSTRSCEPLRLASRPARWASEPWRRRRRSRRRRLPEPSPPLRRRPHRARRVPGGAGVRGGTWAAGSWTVSSPSVCPPRSVKSVRFHSSACRVPVPGPIPW